jgi:hypothetical protein
MIAASTLDVVTRREEYLSKRIERRQAETLIGVTEAQDAVVASRREQQGIDDWYRSRMRQAEAEADSDPSVSNAQEGEFAARRT